MASVRHLELKILNFGHRIWDIVLIYFSVQNFINIWRHFNETRRYDNFQDGGRLPSWICKFWRFSHSTVITHVPSKFCILVQNFAKIRHRSPCRVWKNVGFSDAERSVLDLDGASCSTLISALQSHQDERIAIGNTVLTNGNTVWWLPANAIWASVKHMLLVTVNVHRRMYTGCQCCSAVGNQCKWTDRSTRRCDR